LPEVGPTNFSLQRYLVIPQLLEPALCSFFWSYAHTKFASRLLRGDQQVPTTPSDYGDPAFDGLLEYLRPRVQEHSGLRLLPTYSYFRMYKRGDVLQRHRDRPACEISVALNIGQKPLDPWPIYVQGEGEPRGAALNPGDGLLYRGIELFHWRDAYRGEALVQVFLHYVDRDGPHADQKFDGRPSLMRLKAGESVRGNQEGQP
jgi:hypothetical protein